jgi:ABC-type branched-subunit amino acid transport system ATPase component
MVEHDVIAIMYICYRVIVISQRKIIAEGVSQELVANQAIMNAYLGSEKDYLA